MMTPASKEGPSRRLHGRPATPRMQRRNQAPGETMATITVQLRMGDMLAEDTETFTVTLTSLSLTNTWPMANGQPDGIEFGKNKATGTITDDALTVTVTGPESVNEGGTAEFTVTLVGGTGAEEVDVTYEIGGTATAADYTAPGTVGEYPGRLEQRGGLDRHRRRYGDGSGRDPGGDADRRYHHPGRRVRECESGCAGYGDHHDRRQRRGGDGFRGGSGNRGRGRAGSRYGDAFRHRGIRRRDRGICDGGRHRVRRCGGR